MDEPLKRQGYLNIIASCYDVDRADKNYDFACITIAMDPAGITGSPKQNRQRRFRENDYNKDKGQKAHIDHSFRRHLKMSLERGTMLP